MGTAAASTDTLEGVEMFAIGQYAQADGTVQVYGEDYLDKVLANFGRLSVGPTPLHRVPVVIGHEGQEAYAWVDSVARAPVHEGAKLTPGLKGNWSEVEPSLRKAVKAGRFKKVSVEFKDDFKDNQGRSYGPCLWRVAVLGSDVPKVKGLADLPAAQFADKTHSKFAEITGVNMDRAAAIAYLTSMGVDEAVLSDLPDEALIAIATAWQAKDAEAQTQDTVAGGGMSDHTGGKPATKTRVIQEFSDEQLDEKIGSAVAKALASVNQAVALTTAKTQALDRQNTQRFAEETRKTVNAFLDRMVSEKKVLPRELDEALGPKNLRARLLRADAAKVHKFSESGVSVEKTELQLQMEEIEQRLPHRFSEEKVRAGVAGVAGVAGSTEDPEVAQAKAYAERRNKERKLSRTA